MRTIAAATLMVALWASSTFASQLSSMFVSTSHDFGSVAKAANTEHRFYFDNPYDQPIHVRSVRTSCGCTSPSVETHVVPPRGRGSILAKFNTHTHTGQKGATLTVTFEKPFFAEVQLQVKGYIRTDVVFNPGEAAFGSIAQGKPGSIQVALDYAGKNDWQVVNVTTNESFLTAQASEVSRSNGRVRYNLQLSLNEQAPAGPFQSEIVVHTNDRKLTRVPLRVVANIMPGVTASPTTVSLGDILAGDPIKQLVVLKGQQPFAVRKIESDVFDVEVALSEEEKTLHPLQLVLRAKDGALGTETQGYIRFETTLAEKPILDVNAVFRRKAPAPKD